MLNMLSELKHKNNCNKKTWKQCLNNLYKKILIIKTKVK